MKDFWNKLSDIKLIEDKDNMNDDLFGLTYIFFDGYHNKGEINVINSENYFIESDDKIEQAK